MESTRPTAPAPLAGLRLALVGPGRVGTSLATWVRRAGGVVAPIAGRAELAGLDSSGADGLLIAVPDAALRQVAEALAVRRQAPTALHVSGSRGASALAPLRPAGIAVGSLHPLAAFARALPIPPAGLVCAIDGDPRALELARRLASAWGADAVLVPEAQRLLYHFGATLAAGGSTTLLGLGAELALQLGLPEVVGRGYRDLLRGAIAAFEPAHPESAITGPARRGDSDLVLRQLAALGELRPDLVAIARLLATASLDLLERQAGLDPAQAALRERLSAPPP